jgi:SAM-dependent methyltransferase
MREFWDQRAEEDAFYFVDDRRAYGDRRPGSFWADGERDLDRLLTLAGITIEHGDTVLDIGCGVGRLTRVLAARAATVHGIDVSEAMIERARSLHPGLRNVSWIVGDGRTLQPLPDASIDLCVSHVVFQHIPDPQVTLGYVAEIGRVLRSGGRAAFQLSNDARAHHHRRGLAAARRRLAALARRGPRGQADAAWLGSAIELGTLHATADAAGLTVTATIGEGTQFCLIAVRRCDAPQP